MNAAAVLRRPSVLIVNVPPEPQALLIARGRSREGPRPVVQLDTGSIRSDLDAIFGGILMHALAAPPHLRDRARAEGPAHLEGLVDLVLAGIGAS